MDHAVTEMQSDQVGLTQALMTYWPIILGGVLVLIFMALVVVALYKTNSFNKMRIFKQKLEEEERLAGKNSTVGTT